MPPVGNSGDQQRSLCPSLHYPSRKLVLGPNWLGYTSMLKFTLLYHPWLGGGTHTLASVEDPGIADGTNTQMPTS